ncbi:NlpC/P60 family protein [Streptomyces sp. NPDC004579]|uniref:C40 family peptidase n=1 Tax=Streptomyces sp. NPDC004579 TaxID=3154667 RepID=UPI0033AB4A26
MMGATKEAPVMPAPRTPRTLLAIYCSSLVQYAYWPDTKLPRTAAAQYGATSDRAVSRQHLRVGDLLFWSHGGSAGIYHVAMYTGDGNVIQAPRTGRSVELAPLTSAMPESDYYGATRP